MRGSMLSMQRRNHSTTGDSALVRLARVHSKTPNALSRSPNVLLTPVCSTPFSDRRRQALLIYTPLSSGIAGRGGADGGHCYALSTRCCEVPSTAGWLWPCCSTLCCPDPHGPRIRTVLWRSFSVLAAPSFQRTASRRMLSAMARMTVSMVATSGASCAFRPQAARRRVCQPLQVQ